MEGAASAMPVMVAVQERARSAGERSCLVGEGFPGAALRDMAVDGDGDSCARFKVIKKQNTYSCR